MIVRRMILVALACIATGVCTVSVLADSPAPPPPKPNLDPLSRLERYLEAMDADDWRTREEATIELARDQLVSDQYMEQRLGRSGLSQEQRLRLLRSIETRLLLLPRGALGISMKQHITDFKDQDGEQVRGVEVVELLPGMPAEEHLRVGDVLLSIEDQPFDNPSQVSSLIKQYWPGEEVELEVARDEPADAAGSPRRSRQLRILITLGSTDQLARKARRNSLASSERSFAETRVRSAYQHFSPESRLMLPPEELPRSFQVADLPMGLDPDLILNQLVDDRNGIAQELTGSLTQDEFRAKWESYAGDLSIVLDSSNLGPEHRQVLEHLRARVLELVDIED